jgi:phage terminase small subunit
MKPQPSPEYLDDLAKAKFSALLNDREEWTEHQKDLLAAYCACFSRFVHAEKFLSDPAKHVVTILEPDGSVRKHEPSPEIEVSRKAQLEMARLSKLLRLGRG